MLAHLALHEDSAFLRIESGGQKIQSHFKRIGRNARRVGVIGRQRVQIGDEEVALVLGRVLELDPVGQRTHVVAQVQLAGGAHAAQNARTGRRCCDFCHFVDRSRFQFWDDARRMSPPCRKIRKNGSSYCSGPLQRQLETRAARPIHAPAPRPPFRLRGRRKPG